MKQKKCLNLLYQLLWWLKAVMGAYWEPNMLIFASKSFAQMHSSFYGMRKKTTNSHRDSEYCLWAISTVQCSVLTVIYLRRI